MFHKVSSNSYSIAAILEEDADDFNKPKTILLDQSFLKQLTGSFFIYLCSSASICGLTIS